MSAALAAYLTHDNGALPLLVIAQGNRVTVNAIPTALRKKGEQEFGNFYEGQPQAYTKPLFTSNHVKRIFVGQDGRKQLHGNAIVLEMPDHQYIAIERDRVYRFSPSKGDRIVALLSPIGANDFPYPVALGKTHAYFLLDGQVVPLGILPKTKDAEDLYKAKDKLSVVRFQQRPIAQLGPPQPLPKTKTPGPILVNSQAVPKTKAHGNQVAAKPPPLPRKPKSEPYAKQVAAKPPPLPQTQVKTINYVTNVKPRRPR